MTQSTPRPPTGSSTSEGTQSGEPWGRAIGQGCVTCNDAGVRVQDFDAAIFDLDGVVTRTARVHAAAWKRLFDEYLHQRAAKTGEPFQPFDIEHDYRPYVDGKPRYEGVASFLESRGIALPLGDPSLCKQKPPFLHACGRSPFFPPPKGPQGLVAFLDANSCSESGALFSCHRRKQDQQPARISPSGPFS